MTIVIRVAGANWSGKGLPTIYPFVANDALEFGFDFFNGPNLLLDAAGKHTVTPKRVAVFDAVFNVTDPTILVPVDSGQGIRVDMGYLQSSLPIAPLFAGGARQFTFLLVSRGGELAFPPDKVVGSAPAVSIMLDWGSQVSGSGWTVDRFVNTGLNACRIDSSQPVLAPETGSKPLTAPEVLFLTYDGTSWTLINKTFGFSLTRTNTAMAVADPISIHASGWTDSKLSLGGNSNRASTAHAFSPVVYQRAMWNRVLTTAEINDQYARTKSGRPSLAL